MGPQATWEYRRAIAVRYRQADRRAKGQILDEFCEVTGHHRKAAIHWVETRAVMGKGQARVQQALDTLRAALPFRLRGIDSDNGSEFINHHLYRYCQAHEIQFTRGRPYKKDDNAHIEQKNWTHVRKLVGSVRYDSPAALAALNQIYDDLRLFQNLWLPSVKLVKKTRVGSRLHRQYDAPQTPLDRVRACPDADGAKVAALDHIWRRLDPFALADRIDHQRTRLYALANHRQSPAAARPMDTVENVKNTFPTAPTGPPAPHHTQKTSVTGLTAR